MKLTICCSNFRTGLFRGLILPSLGLLPITAQANTPEILDQTSAVDAVKLSVEGGQLLAVTLLLAAALVVMERFCSWRLGLHHRCDDAAPPALPECLPPFSSRSSVLVSSPEVQQR